MKPTSTLQTLITSVETPLFIFLFSVLRFLLPHFNLRLGLRDHRVTRSTWLLNGGIKITYFFFTEINKFGDKKTKNKER